MITRGMRTSSRMLRVPSPRSKKIDGKMNTDMKTEMTTALDKVKGDIIAEMDTKFAKINTSINTKFADMTQKIENGTALTSSWFSTGILGIVVAIVTVAGAHSQHRY
jgi:hypothetical protein